MVLNATFNHISIISWRSALLVEETGGTLLWPKQKNKQTNKREDDGQNRNGYLGNVPPNITSIKLLLFRNWDKVSLHTRSVALYKHKKLVNVLRHYWRSWKKCPLWMNDVSIWWQYGQQQKNIWITYIGGYYLLYDIENTWQR